MKLNEVVSARFNCTFPIRYNQPAVEYYCKHVRENFPSCLFIFELMAKTNDYTLHRDELRYTIEEAPEVWAELFEAYLYAAYEDVKKNGKKPKNVVIICDEMD